MAGRGVACQFISIAIVGSLLHGTAFHTKAFTKQLTVFNIGLTALMVLPPFFGSQGDVLM